VKDTVGMQCPCWRYHTIFSTVGQEILGFEKVDWMC